MAVNITTDTNTVKVTSTSTNNVKIVDNGNNTSVTVSQPTTRVIKVATVGPQGPAGVIPNTGSFATTGSNSFIGNQVITGSLIVSGSSTFTNIGPAIFSGSVTSTQGFTGSLQGTASAALTASFAQGYVLNSSTSSLVSNSSTSSFITNSQTSSFITNIQTGSFATIGSNQFNGNQTITGSLIQGFGNIATGESSHAEGDSTQAIGPFSHAEGLGTIAYGGRSHAEGQDTIASGSYSHAEGNQTIALADHQHVQGKYNAVSSVPAAFIVGNGTDSENRSNLIHAAGNEVKITGSLNVNGSITGSLFGTASYAITASYALNGGGTTVNTGSFATTGSNTFVGNQIISGAVNTTGTLTVQNAITTPSGQYFVVSSDTSTEMSWSVPFAPSIAVSSGIGTGPSGTSIANISTDSNGDALPIKYWNFNMDGTTTVPGNITGAANLATTGSVTFTGNQIVTGSTRGNVTALSIASNTASMDLSVGNFFTLQLVSGSNTHINPSNILPGQTSILTLSTTGSATVSWPSSVKQPSGSTYVPTTTTGIDIITLASVNSSTLYVVSIKNMI